ncbi:MAG: hypothetical protein KDK69_03900, partial [Chlamydiia bacterium]|nr:hypothetical protein [Chlamydiia bacterium]
VADDDKKDAAVTKQLADQLAAANTALKAVQERYAALKGFTFTDTEKTAVEALKQNAVLVPPTK